MSTDAQEAPVPPRRWARVAAWANRVNLERHLALAFLIGGVSSGFATLAAMSGNFPGTVSPKMMLLLLNLDLFFLLGLGVLIARRLVAVWIARRRGRAGARLHTRLVGLFSLIAVTPAIILAVFSVVFFNFGLQGWFSERVSTAIQESLQVAEAYVQEHRQTIRTDALAMADRIDRQGATLLYNQGQFERLLAQQASVRSLTEAVVFHTSGRVIAKAGLSLLLDFSGNIPTWAMQRARQGEVVTLTAETDDRVRALVQLDTLSNAYLYIGRLIDPKVLEHMDRTQGAVRLYDQLQGKRSDIQITFALIFMVVALLLLMAAVWVGLSVANHLTRPIGGLMRATDNVRAGDLTARATPPATNDELQSLTTAFNRMTDQLQSQQEALVAANRQLDERRRFTEAVLAGVTAGVVGLDADGRIDLPNRTACEMLGADKTELVGQRLDEVAPGIARLVAVAERRPRHGAQDQIQFTGEDGHSRTLLARVTVEQEGGLTTGYVVTFDEITDLLAAQRKAAWVDIARRIAHEIKNPLTPIQLSAERLKRRYLKQIDDDPETFQTCTETIVRHVGDIRQMVDEFSSFARMPDPHMKEVDLAGVAEEAVFLQATASPAVTFDRAYAAEGVRLRCDRQQVSRALTNLLQNAVDAIESRQGDADSLAPGEVTVRVDTDDGLPIVEVLDNGCGLPGGERGRLTEPYVTTRDKGTGLGLAIVQKIMEDHGGSVSVQNRPGGGAIVRLTFAAQADEPAGGRTATATDTDAAATA
ncbi:two-component system, NtrC family, nitrogen regulation sensor histidine kinase NtrY [Limimonas halophila]|uniref:Nitrogen regulation protein n=1 Tax=Limimonas halophila TaxID=1082479 RepID=A0A1G7NCH4_9PROT|nr:PAS domain-containing sensor histidine kinase [Limimonas halophila]SDF71714.1 two-component system, NtrC family, nitrogen regulation sensor histidine kinase NtrY [Limimonas halophila]